MSPKSMDHAAQSKNRHMLTLRDVLRSLPPFASTFFRAIETSTTVLTRLAYAYDLKLFFHFLQAEIPEFAEKSPDKWTLQDLESVQLLHIELFSEYLNLYIKDETERTNAELGKLRKLSALRSFFQYYFKTEKISRNIALLAEMPKRHEKPIIHLEPDEIVKLLDLAETGKTLSSVQKRYHAFTKSRDVAMLTLFLGTGIRVSECVGIDLDDVDFEINGFLVTRKGGNQVILYFSEEVARALEQYIEDRKQLEPLEGHENALFLSMQRKRITTRAVQNLVKKYAVLAAPLKQKISPHKLRSTYGTTLYHETGDIYLVADVLGHTDVNTTRKHYANMSDERRRMAAKAVTLREAKPGETPDR